MNRISAFSLFFVLVFIFTACSNENATLQNRQWLMSKTREFKSLYAVGYDQVSQFQSIDNPCRKGANPNTAALFHAVLQNLNKSYDAYKKDCQNKLGKETEKDALIREHLQDVEKICQPFADSGNLAKCGQVDDKTAHEFFRLKDPIELESAVIALERRIEMKK